MSYKDIFIPATLSKLKTIDPGEIREVTLTVPQECMIDGKSCPVRDEMRPGMAF